MDGNRFDDLARSFAGRSSRRRIIGVLLGALGASLGHSAGAAALSPVGALCNRDSACASGLCGARDRTGRRRCRCVSAENCPAPSNKCDTATCSAGVCGSKPSVTCAAPGECQEPGACNPATGSCSNPPKASGVACGAPASCANDVQHAQDTCDGAGNCKPGTDSPCEAGETCQGAVCGSVCSPVQESCAADADCCQDELSECHTQSCGPTGVTLPRCCHAEGGSCDAECDCCPGLYCISSGSGSGVCTKGCGSGAPCGVDLFDTRRVCCNGQCQECCSVGDCVTGLGYHPVCVACEQVFDARLCTFGQFHDNPCDNLLGVCDEGHCRHCAGQGALCAADDDCCRGACVGEGSGELRCKL